MSHRWTRPRRTLAALVAATALLAAACGEEETAADDTTTTSAAEAESTTTTAAAAQADAEADADGDAMDEEMDEEMEDGEDGDAMADDSAVADAEVGLFLATLFSQFGIEQSDDVIDCLDGRGVDTQAIPVSEEDGVRFTLGLFACAPEEAGMAFAQDTPVPGLTAEETGCVMAETFRYVGELPEEEAIIALDSDDIPPEIEDALSPIVESVCGVDPERMQAVLDS
ncbi:MAG: hypothetical protein AAF547_13525 [Actinomycetota bacterium]